MEKRILLQISDSFGRGAVPVLVNMIPENILKEIDQSYLYSNLIYSSGGIILSDVIYLRKVKKFKQGIQEMKLSDDIVIGI